MNPPFLVNLVAQLGWMAQEDEAELQVLVNLMAASLSWIGPDSATGERKVLRLLARKLAIFLLQVKQKSTWMVGKEH